MIKNVSKFCSVWCALVGFAGCSGGSQPIARVPTFATAAPTVAPSTAPTGPLHPLAPAGTSNAIGTRTEGTINNVAQPVPLPARQVVAQIAQASAVVTDASPFGAGIGVRTVETATTDASSNVMTTVDWYGTISTTGGEAFVRYGETQTDNDPSTPYSAKITYASPLILDKSAAGATWTNDPAETIDESVAGSTTTRTYASDGSYSEVDHSPDGSTQTITENADGSGSYLSDSNTIGFFFSAPQVTAGQVGSFVRVSEYNPLNKEQATVGELSAWYGSSPSLYTERDVASDGVSLPAACELGGGGAHEVDRTIDRTDTIVGYVEALETQSYYVPGIGLACSISHDRSADYYDYTLQSSTQPYLSDHPIRSVTIDEIVHATGAASPGPAAHSTFAVRVERMRSARSLRVRRLLGGI